MKSKIIFSLFILILLFNLFTLQAFAFSYNGKIFPEFPEIENPTLYPYTYIYYDYDGFYVALYCETPGYVYRVYNNDDGTTRYRIMFDDCIIYHWFLYENSDSWIKENYSSRAINYYLPEGVNDQQVLLYASQDVLYNLSSSSDSQDLQGSLFMSSNTVDAFYKHAITYWGDSLEDDPNWSGETTPPEEGGETGDDSILASIGNFLQSIIDGILQLISYINPFSENFFGIKLIEMLSDTFTSLFVPSESNVEEISNTVDEKFGFIDSINLCIETIQDMINNIENGSAVFELDIDSPWYSGTVTLFDLAWYSPFKTYGDLVFTGFAYVFFVFRIYKSIPSILNGFSSVSSNISNGGGD